MLTNSPTTEPALTAIEFRNVSLSFEDNRVLHKVSFAVHPGELTVVTGESGSGKSVLLHLAMGLLKPDEGQIFIDGTEIEILDESKLLSLRGGKMGMVFQEDALFSGMTVFDNVAYRLAERDLPEEEIDRLVIEVLKFVKLEESIDMMPEQLSGGMKRRVEIARALVGWPPVMLYDEPTNSLDPIVAGEVLDLIIRARDINRISSLFVTKELHEIPFLALRHAFKDEDGRITIRDLDDKRKSDLRVILLEAGEIVFTGTHEEFESSAKPVVRHFTHPETGRVAVDYSIPDPWSKRRKPKERIL